MPSLMHDTKGLCELLAAMFAFGAALAWFRAASAPMPFIEFPDSSDPSAMHAAIEAYSGFIRGAVWNKWAAILAGASALSSCGAWIAS